jgi:hypothetical protein
MRTLVAALLISGLCGSLGDAWAREHAAVSVYTDLSPRSCRSAKVLEASTDSMRRCSGFGGYRLLLLDSDSRMSITVIDPQGRHQPLDFWRVVTPYFSTIGKRAEWRIRNSGAKAVPIALIVRLNITDMPSPGGAASHLVVARITARDVCVTELIGSGADANEHAREAADSAADKPCLEE